MSDDISQLACDEAMNDLEKRITCTQKGCSEAAIDKCRFDELWWSTMSCASNPIPRVQHTQVEKLRSHLMLYRNKDTINVARTVGIPMILCFDGHFSASGTLPHCGCNHCETCFHNNVLSLRNLMFGQKKEGSDEETRLESISPT